MKPYYEQDGITIYHGDCRDWLASVPDCLRFDCLLTDPPFGIGFSEYISHVDSSDGYEQIIHAVMFSESLVRDGWAVVFQPPSKAWEWSKRIARHYRLIACCKSFGQIFPGHGPAWRTDYALVWKVGEPRTPSSGGERGKDHVFSDTANTTNRPEHPCPRPLEQIKHLVKWFTLPGFSILDPFMGSGTTLVAAKNLGRRAIGIEIEERYCEIAAKRLSQQVLNLAD